MMKRFLSYMSGIIVLIFFMGCSSSYYSIGQKNLEQENYDEAIVYFQRALEKKPDDPEILRELGIAYYSKPDMDNAIINLLKSFIQNPKDGRTLFYLGTAYEIKKDIPHAIDMYRRFVDVNPSAHIRSSLEARLNRLMQKQMEAEVASIVAQEKSLDAHHISDSTIAVLSFKNIGSNRKLDPIQKGLADMVITDLSKVKQLHVIERTKMQQMIEEMGLGQTGLVNINTAPRVGRLLGASTVIQGNFTSLSKNRLQINGGLMETKRNRLVSAARVQDKLDKFFQMEKQLVFKIVDKLKIKLSQEEIDAIEEIPTENMLAFMAYCKGLDYGDRGLLDDASNAYRNAIGIDPNFGQAQKGLNTSTSMGSPEVEIEELEQQYTSTSSETAEEKPTTTVAAGETSDEAEEDIESVETEVVTETVTVTDYIVETGSVLDQNFLPGVESREPAQEESQNSFTSDILFEIRVPVP